MKNVIVKMPWLLFAFFFHNMQELEPFDKEGRRKTEELQEFDS